MPDFARDFLNHARGIIHVGANEGQERLVYDRHGLKVVWVEALPDVFERLVGYIAPFPRQSAIKALVTDVVGQTFQFRISSNNGESSSILDLAEHRDIWPDVGFVGSIDLVSTTLDQLLDEGAFDLEGIDTLTLDTQGSELLILKGAERVLRSIRLLRVEAADFEAYQGCARAHEIEDWLRARGYRVVERVVTAQHPGGGRYYDLYFARALGDAQLLEAADRMQALANDFVALGLAEVGTQIADAASLLDAQLPEPPGWWSGPFNGQAGRRKVITSILHGIPFRTVLETGTFRGTTTRFFAETFAGPVLSCELDLRWFATARRRLAGVPTVTVEQGDSRAFLARRLPSAEGPLLLYLDAHWNADLPLQREIELVFASGKEAAIVIDDFEVPGDPGYGFDDYGPGRCLTTDILPRARPEGAGLFFPTLPAAEETGARRGYAVIATSAAIAATLDRTAGLRCAAWPAAVPREKLPALTVPEPGLAIRRLIEGNETERVEAGGLVANTLNVCIGHRPFPGSRLGYIDVMISPVEQPVDGPYRLYLAEDARLGPHGHALSEFSQLLWLYEHFDEVTQGREFVRLVQYRKFIAGAPCGAVSDGAHLHWLGTARLPDLEMHFRRHAEGELVSRPLRLRPNSGGALAHYALHHKIEDYLSFGLFLLREGVLSEPEVAEFVGEPDLIPCASVGLYRAETLRIQLATLARAASFIGSPLFQARDGEQRRSAGFLLERLHSHLVFRYLRGTGVQAAQGDIIALW